MEAPHGMSTELTEETSQQFVGQWLRLVSTTNWEKGRIIAEWRQALIDAEAPVQEYSDEAWARRLANISSQHTGRLRRTYIRFGETYGDYPGLYWSHFQAALDWEDAEMWLEGAVQNDWSVADMRRQRGETLGTTSDAVADSGQTATDEYGTDSFDEDAEITDSASDVPRSISPAEEILADDSSDDPQAAGEDDQAYDHDEGDDGAVPFDTEPESVRPFAELAELPADLSDAFESFKLAILRHKLAGWTEVARDDVVSALRSLEQLATAPS